ncbi:MAG: carboxymuconolactone decarboxylase family protein [Alphaproteobacteria bacterium]|nr:carboxymuconolactone decarboxylase family protein [Alphaproteobacteria bacterium]
MSRIATPAVSSATGETAALFAQIKKAAGKVPNAYAAIGALQPAALRAIVNADGVLAAGSLSKQDSETVKLAVSAATGCDYCVAAHSLLLKLAGLAPEAIRQIREGKPTGDAKRDALVAFAWTLVTTSGTLSDTQVAVIRAAGYTDQQLVEISLAVALVIFTNVFNRINDTVVDFPAVN